jgi:predicted CoA-binding protein
MATHGVIDDFLSRKRIAVVGVSRNPRDFSRGLFKEFRNRGYDVVPVTPHAVDIDGLPCFLRVQDVTPPVEAALILTNPGATEQVVRDCAAAGVNLVWMFRAGGAGAVSPAAVAFCREHGMAVVPGECPYMFFPETGTIHRVHGLLRRWLGRYPA